ncbi:c-type cytochrome [Silvibacterium dinghuense]|uniref:C-type cytochrome n=1 Tax=Silvibacterium dinghuense TaxID=1560006 RepID=A0A4Q1SA15_9BACT|nr:c-type cytochrome [Silvibacterium dinghuense]RXS93837.1 c-type cytochrome [Silvibacterium dinghuense]GGH08112.1 hypothetical protein GCM10011586_25490 [Silvibacterium dinghuense]
MKLRLISSSFAARTIPALAVSALLAFAAGCDQAPGAKRVEIVERPDSITNFHTLYTQNCQGCHGPSGQNGAAYSIGNPAYAHWVDEATLRKVIASGEPGTQMPAFAQSSGGMLTDAQVDALVKGVKGEFGAGSDSGPSLPYTSTATGDAASGQKLYESTCVKCHQGTKTPTDPTYLALVNDQTLRTILVAGRPDLGMPDATGMAHGKQVAGYPLNDQQVADVIAYLNSLRVKTPGQPYPSPQQ